MKRFFDIALILFFIVPITILFIVIYIIVYLTTEDSVIYWSERVGQYNRKFKMAKFRTMKSCAPTLASHLLTTPDAYYTKCGPFLRFTSLDEIPQIWNILIGDMSLVGPRPALFNQYDLINLRTKYKISNLKPGLTGWAQISGRDELTLVEKVELDYVYAQRRTLCFDFYILLLTVKKVLIKDGINH